MPVVLQRDLRDLAHKIRTSIEFDQRLLEKFQL